MSHFKETMLLKQLCMIAVLPALILITANAKAGSITELEHEPDFLLLIKNDYLAVNMICLGILITAQWLITPRECITIKNAQVEVINNGNPNSIPVSVATTVDTADQDNSFALLKLQYPPEGKKPVSLANKTPIDKIIPESDWSCVFLSRNSQTNEIHYHSRKVKLKHESHNSYQFTVTPSTKRLSLSQPLLPIKGSALFDEQGNLLGLTFTNDGMAWSFIEKYDFTSTGYYRKLIDQTMERPFSALP
ncbi:hypothetical protein EZMO1_1298 [Endozoicomonas montiporae CL-33]|nr:hypothetical protein EZMO1_1298 [Endozoicomonas montiporae CL-33]